MNSPKHSLIFKRDVRNNAGFDISKYSKFKFKDGSILNIPLIPIDLFRFKILYETPIEKLQLIFTSLYKGIKGSPYWEDKGKIIMMDLCNLIKCKHNINIALQYGYYDESDDYHKDIDDIPYSDFDDYIIDIHNITLHNASKPVEKLSKRIIDKCVEMQWWKYNEIIHCHLPNNTENYSIYDWEKKREAEHLLLDLNFMKENAEHINTWELKYREAIDIITSIDDLYEIVIDPHYQFMFGRE